MESKYPLIKQKTLVVLSWFANILKVFCHKIAMSNDCNTYFDLLILLLQFFCYVQFDLKRCSHSTQTQFCMVVEFPINRKYFCLILNKLKLFYKFDLLLQLIISVWLCGLWIQRSSKGVFKNYVDKTRQVGGSSNVNFT